MDAVEMFLPHVDRDAVEKVLESLRNPNPSS